MALRQWLNDHSTAVALGAGAALAAGLIALLVHLSGASGGAVQRQQYFWDVQTNEPFAVGADTIPPIEAPSGGQGVLAQLFTCNGCGPEEWFGYLLTYTEQAKRQYERTSTPPTDAEAVLVRPLEGGRWMPLGSADVQRVGTDPCPGEPVTEPQPCLP